MRCRWATPEDAARARSASVVRLGIDDRWLAAGSDESYLRPALRAVLSFTAGSPALLATPAGLVTTYIDWPTPELSSLPALLSQFQAALDPLDPPEGRQVLLGLDGSLPSGALAAQTVALWGGDGRLSPENVAVKLNPAVGEEGHLFGWLVCGELGLVPPEFAQGRRLRTTAGLVLALVCNDAVVFTNRARGHPQLTATRRRVADHLRGQAAGSPSPKYVLIATHWQGWTEKGGQSGQSFIEAAGDLTARTGATVVTTLFAPGDELDKFADRFRVVGPKADRVVTLLVEDASRA